MKYSFIVFVFLLYFSQNALIAQDALGKRMPNAIYVEVLGNSLLGSINYERRFTSELSARVGIGSGAPGVNFPIEVNYIVGKEFYFEIGGGATIGQVSLLFQVLNTLTGKDPDEWGVNWTARGGIRYEPEGRRVLLRLAFTPIFVSNWGMLPWVGFSIGVSM